MMTIIEKLMTLVPLIWSILRKKHILRIILLPPFQTLQWQYDLESSCAPTLFRSGTFRLLMPLNLTNA